MYVFIRIIETLKEKRWDALYASIWFFHLPLFGERHVGVYVLEPGLVAAFHVCQLRKEQLGLYVFRQVGELGVHLHCF